MHRLTWFLSMFANQLRLARGERTKRARKISNKNPITNTKLIEPTQFCFARKIFFARRSLLKQVESARLVCIPRERFRFKCRDKYSQRRAITKQNSNENDNNGAAEAAENFNGFFDRTDEKLLLGE